MAYKVVCTSCRKPVRLQSDGKLMFASCGCLRQYLDPDGLSNWTVQESGVIPVSSRKKYCSGCEDNFYNGNNTVGVKVCWNLDTAKVVKKKKIGIDDEPPWEHQPIVTTLSCFHQKGYVFLTDCTRRY